MFGLPTDNVRNIAHAYSLWTRVDRESNAKGKPAKVWRVYQLLGSRPLGPEVVFTPKPSFTEPADLLVIENLNLGYAEERNRKAWSQALAKLKPRGQLVLKHGALDPDRPFWKFVLDQARQNDLRLTVVVSAAALRARNAMLSRALSWDQTLSDIQFELAHGASSRDLAQADQVVIHYGASAVAVFRGNELETFVFRPQEMEGTWEEVRPGKIFGAGSILTATFVRHLVHPGSYPLFTAIAQALAAHRQAHLAGGGTSEHELKIDLAYGARHDTTATKEPPPSAGCIKPITQSEFEKFNQVEQPDKFPFIAALSNFRAAWNPTNNPVWHDATSAGMCAGCGGSRLLCNVTGPYPRGLGRNCCRCRAPRRGQGARLRAQGQSRELYQCRPP